MMFCFPFRKAVTGMIVSNVSQNKRGVDFLQDKNNSQWIFITERGVWSLRHPSDCTLNQNALGLMAGSRQQIVVKGAVEDWVSVNFSQQLLEKTFFISFLFFFFMAIQSNPWKMTQLLLACYVLLVRLEDWTNMFTSASCWTNSWKIVTWCTTLLAGNYTKYLKFKKIYIYFQILGPE